MHLHKNHTRFRQALVRAYVANFEAFSWSSKNPPSYHLCSELFDLYAQFFTPADAQAWLGAGEQQESYDFTSKLFNKTRETIEIYFSP
jgi:hypothetical protein